MSGAKPIQFRIKRIFDFTAALLLLIALSSVLLLIAVLVKCDFAGPVFFRQRRLGFRGRTFRIFKFRTMIPGAVHVGAGLATFDGDPRVTRVGKYLRKYRLDELPQLINVLRGEMSLVGPRPLLPQFLDQYAESDKRRMLMPPGITGWQQVTGGSLGSWRQRIEEDLWYVDHWSLALDALVLLKTPWIVLRANTVFGADGWQRSGIPAGADALSRTKE
jgi:sugar transferase EpsL